MNLDFDIITLNEIKFDDTVPNSRYHHNSYNTIRLDRNGHGGGILVFIKNCYLILEQRCYNNFEIVAYKLKIKNQICNFLSVYKPPNVNNNLFIETLQDIINNYDNKQPIFIIGDPNMDLKSSKGDDLKQFIESNDYNNFFSGYTRIATKFYNKKNQYKTSKTLIDVVLHNKNSINKVKNICCPFSNHNFIAIELKLKSSLKNKK